MSSFEPGDWVSGHIQPDGEVVGRVVDVHDDVSHVVVELFDENIKGRRAFDLPDVEATDPLPCPVVAGQTWHDTEPGQLGKTFTVSEVFVDEAGETQLRLDYMADRVSVHVDDLIERYLKDEVYPA